MLLYFSTIKLSRTALITWSIIIWIYSFLVAYMYNSIKDAAEMENLIDVIPDHFKAAMGTEGDIDVFIDGIMDPNYFITQEYLAWLPLMLAIFSVFYCGGIISREAERGTLDLLLSQPLARKNLILCKLAAFLTMVIILLMFSCIGISLGLLIIGTSINIGHLFLAHIIIGLLIFAVSGYCTLLSCISMDPRHSIAYAGAITSGMYILNFMVPTLGSFKWVANLSLFHHLNIFNTLSSGTTNWNGSIVYISTGALCLVLALLIFERRDLNY